MNAKTVSCGRKLILSISVLGMVLVMGSPARADERGESLFKGKCAMCHVPRPRRRRKNHDRRKTQDSGSPLG